MKKFTNHHFQLLAISFLFLLYGNPLISQNQDCTITGPSTLSLNGQGFYCANDIPANATNITWTAFGDLEIIEHIGNCVRVQAQGCGTGLLQVTYCSANIELHGGEQKQEECCNRCILEIRVPIEFCCGSTCADCSGYLDIADCHQSQGLVSYHFNDVEALCNQHVQQEFWQVWGGVFLINGSNTYTGPLSGDLWVMANNASSLPVTVTVTLTFDNGCDPVVISQTWDFGDMGCGDLGPTHGLITTGSNVKSIFPNPSSTETTIDFELQETSNVSIELFSLKGERMSSIMNKKKLAKGEHQIKMNYAKDKIEKGIYFIVAKFGDQDPEYFKLIVQ